VAQVDLSLLNQVRMYPLAVLPGARLPGGHRALIQPEGGHDRLEGQPWHSSVTTIVTRSAGCLRRKKGVSVVAAKVRPQVVQR
jgi:hypothetical protein